MPTQITQSAVLDTFIDQVLAASGQTVAPEERRTVYEGLRQQIQNEVEEGVITALSDDKLVELNKLMDQGVDDATLGKFFDTAGVDFDKIATEKMAAFRDRYVQAHAGGQA